MVTRERSILLFKDVGTLTKQFILFYQMLVLERNNQDTQHAAVKCLLVMWSQSIHTCRLPKSKTYWYNVSVHIAASNKNTTLQSQGLLSGTKPFNHTYIVL